MLFKFTKNSIKNVTLQAMNNDGKHTVLVVDDEENICEIVQYNLQKNGYCVESAHSAEEALSLIRLKNYDLLLLDIMMGGMSGIELAQVLRQDYHKNTPIIFLSALDTEPDILKGFRIGADDYIPKPFSINQVVARVGAVLNRYEMAQKLSQAQKQPSQSQENKSEDGETSASSDIATVGNLTINVAEHKALIDGNVIQLTKTELGILTILAQNKGKIVSREEILKKVWNGNTFVVQRTVDVHIARVRKKIEGANAKIVNHSGWGYSLVENKL